MKKILIILSSALLLFIIVAEITCRAKGYKPGSAQNNGNLQIQPPALFESDSVLGYRMNPGKYHFKQFASEYDITINSNHHRVTSPNDTDTGTDKPRIFFLGGPSTFGHGVDDDETYPFLMQLRLPSYKIVNLAQLNVGLAENYAQFVSLNNIKKGDVVVYVYHSRHDDRAKQLVKKFNNPGPNLSNLVEKFYYITLDTNLRMQLHKFKHHHWPFSRYSAFTNYLEESFNAKLNFSDGTHDIAEKAVRSMAQICRERGCNFMLVYWRKDEYQQSTLDYCRQNGVTAITFPAHISFTHAGDHAPIKNANIAFTDSIIHYLTIDNMLDTTGVHN
jgi:hypothetical protein